MTSVVRLNRRRGLRYAMAVVAAGAVLLGAGCSGDKSPSWEGDGAKPGAEGPSGGNESPAPPPSIVSVSSPAAGASGVKALEPVKFASEDMANTKVTVKNADGKEIDGKLDTDKGTWTPAKGLAWGGKYTVTVSAPEQAGKTTTTESSFTVMKKPANLVRVTSFLGGKNTVGVGMPLIMRFGRSVPEKYRAEVERRMPVTTTPKQEGTWHWYSGTEVHYRPKVFWKAGTKISYNADLQGVPMGKGWYGRSNIDVSLEVGRSFVMTVDNQNKKMQVRQNGKLVQTIPVSLGKKSTPSSSGTMIVMEKKRHTVFDTTDTLGPEEGYRTKIEYAQRLTWGGEFIHAAPWSDGVQGRVNVSHGCVNVSMKMGAWLFSRTLMGDPITVTGTGRKLQQGNGWTDWSLSWDEYKKGSAL
ncbi:Ig-like domain-containing protein [Actinoplanes sp. NPDC089786]|uniref:L,D-transpeptidase n=1 Tax=Actinoplanes sp. NPDC089786 TaxID=3155185 RepID=UPI0034428203